MSKLTGIRAEYPAEYGAWNSMRSRCLNPKVKTYKNYGGRGIGCCEEWKNFRSFLRDMGLRPSSDHSLERVDNEKGYSPDNCKWATYEEQNTNRRSVIELEFRGAIVRLPDLVRLHGATDLHTVRGRIRKGWDIERALATPKFEGEAMQLARRRGGINSNIARWG